MPIDTLGDEAQTVVRAATAFLRSKQTNNELRQSHVRNLQAAARRLSADIEDRSTGYITELESEERAEINDQWVQLTGKPHYVQVNAEKQTNSQIFNNLRQINGGAFPKNISPVIYLIPLVLVGLAEWYVNFATFAAIFIPVFAIAGTLLVAAAFAWASHMHGAYLKQLAEIIHPSMEYRNVLGRKIALEFVREHQAGLQSFRSMRRIDARRKNASALRLRFSQSLASLRQRLSQAIVRSTTQRRGNTTNPLA